MHELRESEIQNLHLPARGHKDIGRLDVAMDDSLGMRRHQSVCYLHPHVEDFLQGHRLPGDVLLQALSVELFHHNKGMPVVVFNAVDRADIRMVKLRSCPRLAGEPLQRFGVAGQIFWNELQGDMPPQLEVLALVDNAHTTAPQLSKDAVMGYLLTDHESALPCSAVMLGPQPNPVNSLIPQGL